MIVIYGKDNCAHCITAQKLCKSKNIDYTYKKLGEDYDMDEFDKISRETNQRTFPFIFRETTVNKEFIGGAQELNMLLRQN